MKFLAVLLLFSFNSNAALLLFTKNKTARVVEEVIGGTITTTGVVSALYYQFSPILVGDERLAAIGGVVMAIAGVLILDEGGAATVQYQKLSSEEATQLGVTSSELSAYNNQLDEVNAIASEIFARVAQNDDREADPAKQMGFSRSLWNSYSVSLDQDTLTVLGKIAKFVSKTTLSSAASFLIRNYGEEIEAGRRVTLAGSHSFR